ncbi:MAG: S8 family serine peptidase, partial [Deltaproteobacteria bacterium]
HAHRFHPRFLGLWVGLLLLLASCGGGDGNATSAPGVSPKSVVLQGTITAAPYSAIDGSINDPHAPFRSHADFADAQSIGNPARLGGYVTLLATGKNGDTFASQADPVDIYRVILRAGQRATLYVSDFAVGVNEVDLLLRDPLRTGDDGQPLVLDSSVGAVPVQQVTTSRDGDYFLDVQAAAGSSKYLLVISAMPTLQALGYPEPLHPHLEMVPGEVIVTLREGESSLAALSATRPGIPAEQAVAQAFGMQMRGGGSGREILLGTEDLAASLKTLGRKGLVPSPGHSAVVVPDSSRAAAWETAQLARALSRYPAVARVTPNYVHHLQLLPRDPYFHLQWNLPQINLPAAWEITTGSTDTVVEILDSCVFLTHPDLAVNLTTTGTDGDGWNFVDCAPPQDCSNPEDPGDGILPGTSSWHGTHVAGIVAAMGNNNEGIAGSAYNTSLMPVRVCGEGGICKIYDVLQGVRYAAGLANDSGTVPRQRAAVINLSLTSTAASSEEAALFQQVCDAGIIVVAAAGNNSSEVPTYPASYPCVFSVTALDASSELAPYANFGPTVDLAAPGGDMSVDLTGDGYPDGILSTYVEERSGSRTPSYTFLQGTSMAAPQVAGVMALMRSLAPGITSAHIRSWLEQGALTTPLGGTARGEHSDTYGYGQVDALLAVQRAQAGVTPVLVASPSRLNFDPATGPLEFTLMCAGGDLRVSAVTASHDWIRVSPLAVDSAGLGTYQVTVDSASLLPGTYTGQVIARGNNSVTIAVTISLQVPDPALASIPDAGVQYVLALDPESFETRYATMAMPVNGQYRFTMEVEPGNYYLVTGSDLDNDQLICTPGEACGAYVHLDQLELVKVGANGLAGIEFVTSFETSLNDTMVHGSFQRRPASEIGSDGARQVRP